MNHCDELSPPGAVAVPKGSSLRTYMTMTQNAISVKHLSAGYAKKPLFPPIQFFARILTRHAATAKGRFGVFSAL